MDDLQSGLLRFQKIQEAVGKTGCEILDSIRFKLALQERDFNAVREVTISPLPTLIIGKINHLVEIKACYYNTFIALKTMKADERKNAKYVLGYWHNIIPLEHCFLKIGDKYYDPTGELLFEKRDVKYYSEIELTYEQVVACRKLMRKNFRDNDHVGHFEWLTFKDEIA